MESTFQKSISFDHNSFLSLFPKIIKNSDWQVTFVLTFTPPRLNRFPGLVRLPCLQGIFTVEYYKCHFISDSWFIFQVSCWHFRKEPWSAPSSARRAAPWRCLDERAAKYPHHHRQILWRKPARFSAAWSVPITAPLFSARNRVLGNHTLAGWYSPC